MNTFSLKIVASNKVFFDGECENLIVPMIDGGLKGFLANHENVIVPIDVGEMLIKTPDKEEKLRAFVSNGFLEFIDNKAFLVCVSAELPEEIDERRANEAKLRAEEEMRQKQSLFEYHSSKFNLARAMYRLKVKGKM